MMNLYLELSSFEFFFEPFFFRFQYTRRSTDAASASFLSFSSSCFFSIYMHNRASNVCVYRNRKKRLIWHKNILRVRYYFLWFFVMIVIPNTHLIRLPKKTPKITSNSSSFWHHFYSECLLTSNLVQIEDFLPLLNWSTQHTIFRALWWGKQSRS